ncbi:HtaA domain-containing protein [Streptomyces sp. SID11385]|uniref:HtaA domain-containing protein n=1 Tax=Streptomyces sp. SID11385 TaxID=2706031 RepID=UPI0013CD69E0|nr:HtaA domain-containing protein [Streptomyces sp. SID11385]NEA38825.1 Htaa domain protein [Streptomyces sp. SID11385]
MKHASRRRPARTGAFALLLALPLALLPLGQAQAAARTVSGGRLDWGIKSSFQSYVTGPIAHGSWSLSGGVGTVGGSQFRFPSATGTYHPDSGALRTSFAGGVRFVGHKKGASYELDLTISRPTVRVANGAGTLYADMRSKAKGSGQWSDRAQVPLATLDLGGISTKGGGTPIGLADVPATLTAQGASAFAGYYTAGTALDPVTLSVDVLAAAKSPAPPKSPSPSKSPAKQPATKARIEDAALDWGVRRTWREYVTGPVAEGGWTLKDGARDGGALFRFPRGSGTYEARNSRLDVDFTGTLRFTGAHDLDLSLAAPHVRVREGRGTLSAGVAQGGAKARTRTLVTFDAKKLKNDDGLVRLTEAPARLTAEGAEVFGGVYQAGTAMDPVSLAVALDDTAELPALPDIGSGASTAPKAAGTSPSPTASPAATTTASASGPGDGTSALPYVLGAGALVLLAGAGTAYGLRRRAARGDATGGTNPGA